MRSVETIGELHTLEQASCLRHTVPDEGESHTLIVINSATDVNFSHRKRLFDGAQADPNYQPMPEDRPGGFEWGQGRPAGGQQ